MNKGGGGGEWIGTKEEEWKSFAVHYIKTISLFGKQAHTKCTNSHIRLIQSVQTATLCNRTYQ